MWSPEPMPTLKETRKDERPKPTRAGTARPHFADRVLKKSFWREKLDKFPREFEGRFWRKWSFLPLANNHKRPLNDKDKAGPLALFNKVRNFRSAEKVRALGLYPYFRTISSVQDSEVMINGRKVLMLGSNSYLGLTNHPKIKEAARAAVTRYGTGCAGSRFLNGTLDIHLELERRLAQLVHKEAALLYSTGFQVNLGVISALVGKGDYVLADKSDHASIVDGCQLCHGQFVRFAHNDMAALENQLTKIDPAAGKLIVVDGVFSMEGDIIRLPEVCRLAKQYGAAVMVDDAHGIGVLGEEGRGHRQPFRPDRSSATDHGHVQQVAGEPGRFHRVGRRKRLTISSTTRGR